MIRSGRLLCLIFAAMLFLFSVSAEEIAATPTDLSPDTTVESAEGTHPYLELSAGEEGLTVTGCSDRELTSVTIPSAWNGVKIVAVGERAFEGMASLEKVTIAEGIVSIGARAFADCTALRTVQLPDSLTDLADDAFSGCDKLTAGTQEQAPSAASTSVVTPPYYN